MLANLVLALLSELVGLNGRHQSTPRAVDNM
jgi:hypothetical protein